MVIYTKKGDSGSTSVFDKLGVQRKRISKDSPKIEVLGEIDELNSFLGIVKSETSDRQLRQTLGSIQKDLLVTGSIIAGSNLHFSLNATKKLEKLIDKLEATLPVLKNFIVPGGTPIAAKLMYARALTRRVERRLVSLAKDEDIAPQILSYLNRLSDALFMLSRKANASAGVREEVWTTKKI